MQHTKGVTGCRGKSSIVVGGRKYFKKQANVVSAYPHLVSTDPSPYTQPRCFSVPFPLDQISNYLGNSRLEEVSYGAAARACSVWTQFAHGWQWNLHDAGYTALWTPYKRC